MKKTIAVAVFIFVAAVTGTFAQTMVNVNTYSKTLLNSRGGIDSKYISPVSDDDYERFCILDGDLEEIDTSLEIALLSYYSPAVVLIRPAEAKAMLPADNPKLSGQILGANLYKEIQVLRFLASTGSAADTNAVGRYESMLKFVCDRNKVTPAEIEAYYRNGIRGFIAGIVDEEFNKISFFIENITGSTANSYNGVLTRNPQNGQYKLSYEDARDVTKELSAQTLKALLDAMRNSGDFSPAAINTVEAQAKLIPAVAYPASTLADVVNIITSFYLNPSQSALSALRVKYRTFQLNEGDKGEVASESLYKTIRTLNPALSDSMISRR
jgi:hypothetical protein